MAGKLNDFSSTQYLHFLSRINFGINPVIKGFSNFKVAAVIWFTMQFVTILIYPVFRFWANCRKFTPKGENPL